MDADPAASISAGRRWLILIAVVLASSLYSTTLLTTSTILPQMQGALSATQDEIAWVMTFNILATAVVTPMTGWLVARFGVSNVMVWIDRWRSRCRPCCAGSPDRSRRWWCGASCRAAPVRRSCRCRRPSCSTASRAGSRRWCCSIFGMAVVSRP